MLRLHSVRARIIGSIGLRILWWGTIAFLFTYINITQSIAQGKLSLPPVYDDVAYLLEGATWLNALRDNGFVGLLASPIVKSPVMVFIAFLGFLLFGFQIWAPYAINGLLVFGLLIGLDLLSRELPLYQRLLLPLTALTYPLAGNLVMEFRPDVVCSISMAFYVAVALRMEWQSAPKFFFDSWRHYLGLSSILAFALLSKPSIFPITLLIAAITLFCAIVANSHFKEAQATQATSPLHQRLKTIMTSLGLSLLLASPYYIFGGLKQIIGYIQIVVFGPNRGIWTPNFPLDYNLTYYLIGRGGWMMGAWFWVDMVILVITLAAVIYRRQWNLARRSIAAILIFISADISVTIPSTKSPFLGLIVTALLLILSYLSLVYWLEFLNNWLKKSISKSLGTILGLTIISSLIFFQWRSFPFIGGGITLLPPEEAAKYNQSLDNVVQVFRSLYPSLSKTDRQTIFIPASTSFLNPTNLSLMFQFDQIQIFESMGVSLNQDNLDDIQTYKNKSLTSSYTILVRSPSVTYPSLNKKGGNTEFGEELYHFLEISGEFERIDRQTTSILPGELLIYRRKASPKS
jgi:hypothetical protein